ncbi:unnamed protein product [Psylliodes chrysocephalus]|uniref:PiggyBac transposable element-derived protein domain-containing protein n=1 Tax=Psylliodes chrysocephalus TaxID=3402493 RepID=A0A9P0C8S5_9CUCU|nr:unnamed protein product [Psylliodes chrysocephala]
MRQDAKHFIAYRKMSRAKRNDNRPVTDKELHEIVDYLGNSPNHENGYEIGEFSDSENDYETEEDEEDDKQSACESERGDENKQNSDNENEEHSEKESEQAGENNSEQASGNNSEQNNAHENEQSNEQERPPRATRNKSVLRGKNNHLWSSVVPQRRGFLRADIVLHLPGPKGDARKVETPLEVWNLIISEDIIETITIRTNEQIKRNHDETIELSYTKTTNVIEHIRIVVPCFWDWNFPAKISVFSYDNKADRHIRRQINKFTPIIKIWDVYISNCKAYYTPYEYCTIDEQLMSFPRKTNRWSMRVFYGMLDGSGINSMILLTFAKGDWAGKQNRTRRNFLKELGMSLVIPFLRERLRWPTLRRSLRQKIMDVLNEPVPDP